VIIGQLRHRVTLQQAVEQDDGYGGRTVTWQDVATVWAAVEPLRGDERYRAQQVRAQLSHRVTIRYRPGVRPGMRVVYGGRLLAITAVIDPEERHERLELLCEEEVSGS